MSLGLPALIWLENSSEPRNCNPELHSTFRINSTRLWGPTVCKPCVSCVINLVLKSSPPPQPVSKWQRLNLNTDLPETWVHSGMSLLSLAQYPVILSTWRVESYPLPSCYVWVLIPMRVTINLLWHNWRNIWEGDAEWSTVHFPHFAGEETKAQRGLLIRLKSQWLGVVRSACLLDQDLSCSLLLTLRLSPRKSKRTTPTGILLKHRSTQNQSIPENHRTVMRAILVTHYPVWYPF